MSAYRCKIQKISGTSYNEIERKARQIYKIESRRTKRNPYVRSLYFGKDKVFLEYFWHHLATKRRRDRKRRLYYYEAALDLIRNSTLEPLTKPNPNNGSQIVHRFKGATIEKTIFYVQIVEDRKSGRKYFMSVFPKN